MPRVVHFEIPVENPERSIKFYSEVFGWSFHRWEGPQEYWLIGTGDDRDPGINGGLMRRNQNQMVINTIDVASVDEFSSKITRLGGAVVVPKTSIPGVGYLAYFTDPDGNMFGIMQREDSSV